MKDLKIIAVLYLIGAITMVVFFIPVFIFTEIKIIEYILYYMFSFTIVGIFYYKVLERNHMPIIWGTLVVTIIFLAFYFGFRIQVAIICALATLLSVLITIKSIGYFNDG